MRLFKNSSIAVAGIALFLIASTPALLAQASASSPPQTSQDRVSRFPGMDQSVNVDLAAKAGIPPRKPYINVEEWGDLWNFLLLFGGGVAGFLVGRRWDYIWGRRH